MLVCFCAVPFSVQVKNIGPVFDLGCFCCQFYFLSYLNAYFYFHACLICQRSEAIYLKWQNQTADVAECLRYFYNFSAFFFFCQKFYPGILVCSKFVWKAHSNQELQPLDSYTIKIIINYLNKQEFWYILKYLTQDISRPFSEANPCRELFFNTINFQCNVLYNYNT